MAGLFTWLGLAAFGALGIKNAYNTSKVNGDAYSRAVERGDDYYFGRHGEMYDVVTGKRCRIKKLSNGRAWLVEIDSDKFIRDISTQKEADARETALSKNHLGYYINVRASNSARCKVEAASGRIYEVDSKNSTIIYYKIEDRIKKIDGVRSIPKDSWWYYYSPETEVPTYMMQKIIEAERAGGIYREQR